VDHNGYPDFALVSEQTTVRNRAHVFKESSVAASLTIRPVFPRGGEKFYGGAIRFIDWLCAVPSGRTARIRLELSTTGSGGPWTLIADTLRDGGRYQWRVPTGVNSTNCFIRYKATAAPDSALASTPSAFTINSLSGIEDRGPGTDGPGVQGLKLNVASPSRNSLALSYCLPKACAVRVELYDALGRKVGVLREGMQEAGWHAVRDFAPRPAGVYFVRVRTETRSAQGKVLILK
jgi:hypothetical protein